MRRHYVLAVLCMIGCAVSQDDGEPIAKTSQQLTDGNGNRWYYVGPVGSEAATRRDPKWANVDFESLSHEEQAFFLRAEMIVRGDIYRLSDDDVMETVPLMGTENTEVWKSSLPAGREDEAMPGTYIRYAKHIFGSDNRTDASNVSHTYPWNNFATVSNSNTCTAFKVYNHYTGMTAGHCFGDNWSNGPAWIRFGDRTWSQPYPSFGRVNSSKPFAWGNQCYTVTRPTNYSESNLRTDWAVFKFRDTTMGIDCGSANYNVGYLGKSYGYSDPQYIIGYPRDPPGGLAYPSLVYEGGEAHSGDDGRRQDTDEIDATSAQSGAPWIWIDSAGSWYVTAVHVREYWVPFDWENQGVSVHNQMWSLVPGMAGN